jgi:predicted nucleic acid-binding protein
VILVDTNVLLDVLEEDAEWCDWSQGQLDSASATDTLAINPIIYSELSIGFARIEELEALIKEASLAFEDMPREALFLAGKAFLRYRRSRGTKRGVLPDFYIGAHAAVMHWSLLTRDVGRYGAYFPKLSLIAP